MAGRFRVRRPIDYWPSFVDALTVLLLSLIFLLSILGASQFFLSAALSGRDEKLRDLSAQLAEMAQQLALEKGETDRLRGELGRLQASMGDGSLEGLTRERDQLATDLAAEKKLTADAKAEADRLNATIAAMTAELAKLNAALEASAKRDEEQKAVIVDLGKKLNQALAQKVEDLTRYRSEFFGKLREVLGNRPEIRVVGDRFVFQSEVLFPSGVAEMSEAGKAELAKLAAILKDIAPRIPPEVKWVLRVDGHTDNIPIKTAQFPGNWELSTARATNVVRYLIERGLPPDRLAAAGFGEFQPLEKDNSPDARAKNRRIELRLTDR
jgi:chemotaxis protein MotB